MEALIDDLVRRRNDAIADTEELASKLTAAAEQHRSEELQVLEPAAETEIVPETDETVVPETDETDLVPETDETDLAPEPQEGTETAVQPQETEEHEVTAERETPPEPRPEQQANLRPS